MLTDTLTGNPIEIYNGRPVQTHYRPFNTLESTKARPVLFSEIKIKILEAVPDNDLFLYNLFFCKLYIPFDVHRKEKRSISEEMHDDHQASFNE